MRNYYQIENLLNFRRNIRLESSNTSSSQPVTGNTSSSQSVTGNRGLSALCSLLNLSDALISRKCVKVSPALQIDVQGMSSVVNSLREFQPPTSNVLFIGQPRTNAYINITRNVNR